MILWHYTCDHGHDAIGDAGYLIPPRSRPTSDDVPGPYGLLVWLTDLDVPYREALGLTSTILGCDRTAHRYRVNPEAHAWIARWTEIRRDVPIGWRVLELAPGAMPAHWFVAAQPVPVTYAPRANTTEHIATPLSSA